MPMVQFLKSTGLTPEAHQRALALAKRDRGTLDQQFAVSFSIM
jgi:hypothetical protein